MDGALLRGLVTFLAAGVLALAVHVLAFRMVFRYGWRTPASQLVRQRLRWPARGVTLLTSMVAALPIVGLRQDVYGPINHALVIVLILTIGWLGLRGAHVAEDIVEQKLDVAKVDNLRERRRLTQIRVIRRLASLFVVVLTGAGVMLTFPTARSLGASLLASAGVVGVFAGVASRSTLGNLVAGIQIAFAEPIRIDDVVIVEGNWGRIEEITLTYVVVNIWDQRRMVVPTTWFIDQPFENWTRSQSQIIGQVSVWADWRVPVDEVRAELERLTEGHPLWDGAVRVLQVVDTTPDAIQLRALLSARDAAEAWDLRCDVREGLVAFLRDEHPAALPHARLARGWDDPA